MAAVISRLFGQARMQPKQASTRLGSLDDGGLVRDSLLNFLLFGAISIATRTATSPTFSGSRMAAPASLPSTRDRMISSGSSPVLSGSPWRFLALVTMRGARVFIASRRTSARMHCSSTTMTSAMPDLMNLSWWERAPTILLRALYRVRSRAVQQIPATSILSSSPRSCMVSAMAMAGGTLWPITRMTGFSGSMHPAPQSTRDASGSPLGKE